MDKIFIMVSLFSIAVLGLVTLIRSITKISTVHAFAIEFLEKLKQYVDSNGRDIESYTWLVHRSNKLQNQMGGQGIIAQYRPPYQNFAVSNYPIVINMLPDLRNALEDSILSDRLTYQYATALQEAIIRHIGIVEDSLNTKKSEVKNPIIWLREGFRFIIAFPVSLLSWFGIIKSSTVNSITSNFFFKSITGIIAFITFFSAIVTLVLGWDKFIEQIKPYFA